MNYGLTGLTSDGSGADSGMNTSGAGAGSGGSMNSGHNISGQGRDGGIGSENIHTNNPISSDNDPRGIDRVDRNTVTNPYVWGEDYGMGDDEGEGLGEMVVKMMDLAGDT